MLGSLQEKIDPDFLFATLTGLEELYETDPAAADRLLDEAISHLRSAVAGVRASVAAQQRASPPILLEPAADLVRKHAS